MDSTLWRREKELGEGGFGQVTLYVNKETGEHIAVKRCRRSLELSLRHKEKWRDEVEIMARLENEHIIKSLPTPDELRPSPGDPAVLVMEYCSGGDLRQMLAAEPCGVSESNLRRLVRHIAAGVEYLHSRNITHRDIKPENIVIKKTENGEKIYKIIDLGYAKEKVENSMMYSFVGTMQYLAPELLMGTPFRSTVDFWSFGVVLFECIAGVRPFRLGEAPVRLHEYVSRKKNEEITIYYNIEGDIKVENKLPTPNQLCRTSRAFFVQFLRLMLTWDADTRGGRDRKNRNPDQRDKCWSLLENILDQPLIFIYCVPTNQLLTYPIDATHKLRNVQAALEKETGIPVQKQDLLRCDGTALSTCLDELANKYCCEDEQSNLFLFKKFIKDPTNGTDNASELFPSNPDVNEEIPDCVRFVFEHSLGALLHKTYHDTQRFMAEAGFYCADKAKQYWRLFCSSRAALNSLMVAWNQLMQQKKFMNNGVKELLELVKLADEGFRVDIEEYKKQGNFICRSKSEEWLRQKTELNQFRSMVEEERTVEQQTRKLQALILTIQQNPLVRPTSPELEELTSYSKNAHSNYATLKKMRKEGKDKPEDLQKLLQKMLETMQLSKEKRQKHTIKLYEHLKELLRLKVEVLELGPRIVETITKIQAHKQRIREMQMNRQRDMWQFIQRVFDYKKDDEGSNVDDSLTNIDSLARASFHIVQSTREAQENWNKIEEAQRRVSKVQQIPNEWVHVNNGERMNNQGSSGDDSMRS